MKSIKSRATASSAKDPVAQPIKKYSASPLIDPAVCGLVVILPSIDDHSYKLTRTCDGHVRKTKTLLAASQAISVPVFVCGSDTVFAKDVDVHCTFSYEEHGCIWKNKTFRKALDAENLSALVLAGYWLDREVTITALHALADCYDVYIPVDASPTKSARPAARLAEARLLQAGASPLLTEQILQEWMIETSSPTQRAALSALLE